MATTIPKATKKTKKPGMGKRKGNAFESKIAKLLSASLPLSFIRSPGSGARVGGVNFDKFGAMFGEDALKLFVADVVPTNEKDTGYNFKWSIECKSYASQDTFTSLVNGTAKMYGWFQESVVDAAKVGKQPMLIMKWNNTQTFVVVEKIHADAVKPSLIITPSTGEALAIYLFDDVINQQDFWVTKLI